MKTITALSEDILRFVEKCESPIEQLFAIWLFQYYYFQWAHIDGCKETMLNISVQKEITCEDCSYRVDFYLEFTRKGVCQKVIIECDGHEFHEKTKEQAANDKRRDRDLVKNGYTILRFTGSEIYKDASKCVGEVFILFTRKKSE
jgi:very-short-patch-repair endonuclease